MNVSIVIFYFNFFSDQQYKLKLKMSCGQILTTSKDDWVQCAKNNVKDKKVMAIVIAVVTVLIAVLIIISSIQNLSAGGVVFGAIVLAIGGGISYYYYTRDMDEVRAKVGKKAEIAWDNAKNKEKAYINMLKANYRQYEGEPEDAWVARAKREHSTKLSQERQRKLNQQRIDELTRKNETLQSQLPQDQSSI